jgi:hypothetical protein
MEQAEFTEDRGVKRAMDAAWNRRVHEPDAKGRESIAGFGPEIISVRTKTILDARGAKRPPGHGFAESSFRI